MSIIITYNVDNIQITQSVQQTGQLVTRRRTNAQFFTRSEICHFSQPYGTSIRSQGNNRSDNKIEQSLTYNSRTNHKPMSCSNNSVKPSEIGHLKVNFKTMDKRAGFFYVRQNLYPRSTNLSDNDVLSCILKIKFLRD